MELKVEGDFYLRGFTPHQLAFLPSLNSILLSDARGSIKCLDIVSGKQYSLPELVLPRSSTLLCQVHQTTSKLVMACGNRLAARLAHEGCLQSETFFQTPVNKSTEEVTIELPVPMVHPLLKELTMSTFNVKVKSSVVKQLEYGLTKIGTNNQFETVCFTEKLNLLLLMFEELVKLNTQDSNSPSKLKFPGSPVASIASHIVLRLQLLDPVEGKRFIGFERGDGMSSNEIRFMHIEAVRKLSLAGWPHADYKWAIPKTMAEAGFYQTSNTNHGVNAMRGDRVSCFCCRVYLYSWEPTDEPWSEHERHAYQCQFVRGEYTSNVPLTLTESSHPAQLCGPNGDTVVCMSAGAGSRLVALGMEQGRVSVWDLDRGLFIMEHAQLDLTDQLISMYLVGASTIPSAVQASSTSTSSETQESTQDKSLSDESKAVEKLSSTVLKDQSSESSSRKDEQTSTVECNTEDTASAEDCQPGSSTAASDEPTVKGDLPAPLTEALSHVQPSLTDQTDTVKVDPVAEIPETDHTVPTLKSLCSGTENKTTKAKSSVPDTEPVSKKRNFHITALAVVSVPVLRKLMHQTTSTFLITGITVVRDGKVVPILTLHLVSPKKQLQKKTPKAPKVYTTMQDPLEDLYVPLGEPVPHLQGSASSWEAPSKPSADSLEFPATLEHKETIVLGGKFQSKGMSEIKQIVPLNKGCLLAVTCSVSSALFTEEKSESANGTVFIASLAQKELLSADSKTLSFAESIVCVCAVTETVTDSQFLAETNPEDHVLLAVLLKSGRIEVYNVNLPSPSLVATYDMAGSDPEVELVDCVYCPTTNHLAVATKDGRVCLLKLKEQIKAGSKEAVEQEALKQELQSRLLTIPELDQLSMLTETSLEGLQFEGSTPHDWRQISLYQYNRGTPTYLHDTGRGKKVKDQDKAWQSGKVWLYQPPASNTPPRVRYQLELTPMSQTQPRSVSSISVTLKFASGECVSEQASLSLHLPKLALRGDTPTEDDQSNYSVLLGPIKLKPFVDVTGKSLSVVLSHPQLVTSSPTVLWLVVEDLFSSNYNKVSFSSEAQAEPSNVRAAWRTKAFRHYVKQPTGDSAKAKNISVQATLSVTLNASRHSLDTMASHPLLAPSVLEWLVCEPGFITQLALGVCGCVLEEREGRGLSEPLRAAVIDKGTGSNESRIKALDILCWVATLHCNRPNSEGYSVLVNALSGLLTSVLHSCYVRGDRILSHKCARLLLTLCRNAENTDQFQQSLSQSLLKLLPVVPLIPSAACVHWLLRITATLSHTTCQLAIARECLCLLVGLTRELKTRNTLTAQLLQTHFKKELSIFEPELFDIYLSYSQKSTTVTVKSPPKPLPATPVLPPLVPQASFDDPEYEAVGVTLDGFENINTSLPTPAVFPPPTQPALEKVHSSTSVLLNNGNTIYDSELQLLVDSKGENELKVINEDPIFKHGSFLLYTQRGLLDTVPLEYSCVSANTTVKTPSIHTVRKPNGETSASTVPMTPLTKTSGYTFPSINALHKHTDKVVDFTGHEVSSKTRLPSSLSDILVFPKELLMQIESVKSGASYSATLELGSCEVALTDICIQSSPVMSSVCVEVWRRDGVESETVRIAHSSEIAHKSLMLGNISPPPICQFVKVTFIGKLGMSRDKAQVFIGTFYGSPIVPPEQLSPIQLYSLEESILSQYHSSRDKLTSALLAYSNHSQRSQGSTLAIKCEEEVNSCYQQCFRAQVQLARLRRWRKRQDEEECVDRQYNIDTQASSIDIATLPASKLTKLTGCIVDALLVLNNNLSKEPKSLDGEECSLTLTEDDCCMVFSSLCIHGNPKCHARASALLIGLCGSQPWWGHFVTSNAMDLLAGSQSTVFKQDRALIQLSALSQRTYEYSDVLTTLLTQLSSILSQFLQTAESHVQQTTQDQTLLQWMILLLSHIFSSLTLKDTSKSHPNLFQPVPLLPTPITASIESVEQEKPKVATAKLHDRRTLFRHKLTKINKEMKYADGDEKKKLMEEYIVLRQDYRDFRSLSPSPKSTPARAPPKTVKVEPGPPLMISLPPELCRSVVCSLVQYVLTLISGSKWELVPVVCKLLSLLVTHTMCYYPLYTIVSPYQLQQLMSFCCQQYDGDNEMQWSKRAVQCLLVNALHHGEIKHFKHRYKSGWYEKAVEPQIRHRDFGTRSYYPSTITTSKYAGHKPTSDAKSESANVDIDSASNPPSQPDSGTASTDSLLAAPSSDSAQDKATTAVATTEANSETIGGKEPVKPEQDTASEGQSEPEKSSEKPALSNTKDALIKEKAVVSDSKKKLKVPRLRELKQAVQKIEAQAQEHSTSSQTNKVGQGRQAQLYQSFIISSSVEARLLGSCDLPAEIKLQALSQSVYESILSSLVNVRPCSDQITAAAKEEGLEQLAYEDERPLGESMRILLKSIEYLLEQSRQPHSNVDLVTTLEFWQELSLLIPSRKTAFFIAEEGTSEPKDVSKLVTPLSSEAAFDLLLESLLETSNKSSKLWQLGLSLMHTSLTYLAHFSSMEQRDELEQKMGLVFVKFFSINFTSQEIDEDVLKQFLQYVCQIKFQIRNGAGVWYGSNFLLELLVTVLQDGDMAILESTSLLSLLSVLGDEFWLPNLWKSMNTSSLYQTVKLVHQLCLVMVDWLPHLLDKSDSPGIHVFGNENDEDRRRYNRYPGSAQQEVKWVSIAADVSQNVANITPKLIQFLRDVLSAAIPDEALFALQEYCQNSLQSEKDGSEATEMDGPSSSTPPASEHPLLVLVFKDTQLLTNLLKILNSVSSERKDKRSTFGHDFFTNFFHFLVGHCNDRSCFFQPILKVLDSTSDKLNISVVFRALISRLLTEFVEHEDTNQLVQFINNGGGKLIIECLVLSCKAPSTDGLASTSVTAIGTKKQLKTVPNSTLVNFMPLASIHGVPSRTSATDLTTSGPSRSSTLHHTFGTSEQNLVLHITLPYPVLLHCIQLFQPIGHMQSGPSSVFVKVSPQGSVCDALPVTPLIQTSGLSSVKIELQQPQIAQEVLVYLGRPFASNSLALSHMHLLGLPYGSRVSVGPKDNRAVTKRDGKNHPSAGWLHVIAQWLSVCDKTRDALLSVCSSVSDLLPSCLSLFSNNHSLSQESNFQLQHILITMATHLSDYGDEIIKYLFGQPAGQTPTQQDSHVVARETTSSLITAVSLDLLCQLCRPTSDSNRHRLDMAIQLLSNQLQATSSLTQATPTPTLVRALSSAVWAEKRSYSEDVFRSLAELAFSLEVGHPLKSALNSLLCSLCNAHPPLYTLILARCHEAVSHDEHNLSAFLQTLAQVSQSASATESLLESDLASMVTTHLLSGIDWLLQFAMNTEAGDNDADERTEAVNKMRAVSVFLAFLTDLMRNWKPAKDWMGRKDNQAIWQSILAFLCTSTSRISGVDLSFMQDVACEFFAACVHNHTSNKSAFIQLFCNSLRGHFELESAQPGAEKESSMYILTPFLYKLLTELILRPGSIPLVLCNHTTKTQLSTASSLTPTHEADDFHPSFPVSSNWYYVKVPAQATLGSIETIIFKQEAKAFKLEEPPPIRRKPLSRVAKSKTPAAPVKETKLDITGFRVKEYSLLDTAIKPSSMSVDFTPKSESHISFDKDTKVGQISECSDSGVPMLSVQDSGNTCFSKSTSDTDTSPCRDLLEHFLSENGLFALAQCLHALYPYHWPQAEEGDHPTKRPSQVFLDLPSRFPAHSVLMLGMCMKIPCYSDMFGENPPVVFVLLKLILKAKIKDQLSDNLIEKLAFLPYLVFLEALRRYPSDSEEGHVLRQKALEVGVVNNILQCMCSMGKYSPRRERENKAVSTERKKSTRMVSFEDSQYWAKGTGFGTGSTTSNWDINATLAKKKLEEKYISLCFEILAEYLAKGAEVKGQDEATPPEVSEEVVEMLSDSCLLPALASYLHNDSVLDISKHVDLYNSTLDVLFSIASNGPTQHLLLLSVFSVDEPENPDTITLSSLTARLRRIVEIYKKTAGLAPGRQASPSKPAKQRSTAVARKARDASTPDTKPSDVKPPGSLENSGEYVELAFEETDSKPDTKTSDVKPPDSLGEYASEQTDSKPVETSNEAASTKDPLGSNKQSQTKSTPLSPQDLSPPSSPPPPLPPHIPRLTTPTTHKSRKGEDGELAILVDKILSTSEIVAEVVTVIRFEKGSLEPAFGNDTKKEDSSFDAYSKVMGPLQFDAYQFTEEDEDGKVKFLCPYFYQSKIQKAATSSSAARARRLAQEVSSLSTSLPLSPSSSVFVRCDEERLDVMKVMITGPSETPYANGCFEFDVFFPPDYPQVPMLVNLMTTGQKRVRFNPNLYNDGKVCLSILNTWHGRPEEKWNGQNSSFLQVLVSIQSLIFVPEPYFNEPGYERYRGTPHGDQKSLSYNANLYVANVQWAMINQLRNPAPCFKEVILKHFSQRKAEVFSQCEQWRKELVAGIRRAQERGETTTHLDTHLQNLNKSIDTLHSEIDRIDIGEFEGRLIV